MKLSEVFRAIENKSPLSYRITYDNDWVQIDPMSTALDIVGKHAIGTFILKGVPIKNTIHLIKTCGTKEYAALTYLDKTEEATYSINFKSDSITGDIDIGSVEITKN